MIRGRRGGVVLLDPDDTLVYEQRSVPAVLTATARLAEPNT